MQRLNLKNRKGQNIVGVLEIPEGEIKGTCIVQHGWGGNKEKSTVQAMKNGFLESGFQAFNFDATNTFGESDGDYEKSTLGLHWEDFEDVTKWVQQQDWFVGPLAITGHSKGGYAVARYAEEHPEEVGYVVPVAPVVSGELSFKEYEARDPEGLKKWKEEGIIETTCDKEPGRVKRKHWFQMEERLQHDLLPSVDKITMPVLLIVGSKDSSCLGQTKVLFDAIPGGNKEIKIIEGAPHSYYEQSEQEECTNAIKNWLNKQI